MSKVAACRDRDGKLHACSAVCTHLGCHVHWNSTEQCWDCPCHGSQFAPDGAVLNGPALAPLERVTLSVKEARHLTTIRSWKRAVSISNDQTKRLEGPSDGTSAKAVFCRNRD